MTRTCAKEIVGASTLTKAFTCGERVCADAQPETKRKTAAARNCLGMGVTLEKISSAEIVPEGDGFFRRHPEAPAFSSAGRGISPAAAFGGGRSFARLKNGCAQEDAIILTKAKGPDSRRDLLDFFWVTPHPATISVRNQLRTGSGHFLPALVPVGHLSFAAAIASSVIGAVFAIPFTVSSAKARAILLSIACWTAIRALAKVRTPACNLCRRLGKGWKMRSTSGRVS
jgi:hypothetical protein